MTSVSWRMTVALASVMVVAAGSVGPHAQSRTLRESMNGGQLFRAYCGACHGEDARGHGPAAEALKTPPSDLTAIALRSGGAFPRARLINYIREGEPVITAHGSKDMPVWGANLVALSPVTREPVNARIAALVSYLASIQRAK